MYLFDTNILSELMKSSPSHKLLRRMRSVPVQNQFTSSINLGELIFGACKKRSKKKSEQIEQLVKKGMPVLPFDDSAARIYGEIRVHLENRGTPIGDADTRIAAIALDRKLIVITANIKHFQIVPNLTIENWL